MFVKNCKKCSFSAPKIKKILDFILKMTINEVQCYDCNNKLYFKSHVKKHEREVHYKGSSLQGNIIIFYL